MLGSISLWLIVLRISNQPLFCFKIKASRSHLAIGRDSSDELVVLPLGSDLLSVQMLWMAKSMLDIDESVNGS